MQEYTKVPIQHSNNKVILLFKKFLHTKIGARIGFSLGLKGFNRIEAIHSKFLRYWKAGEKYGKGEFLLQIPDTAKFGIYIKVPNFNLAYNSRVNKGGDLAASLIAGTSFNSISTPLPPKYVALSTSSLTPAAGDTTLTGETSASGLGRALGSQGTYVTPSVLDGACSYVVTKTFTNTSAGAVTIVSTALFDAVSSGNLFAEANLSASAILQVNDVLVVNWTINL